LMQHKNQCKKLMQIKEQEGFTFKNNALLWKQNVDSWGEGIIAHYSMPFSYTTYCCKRVLDRSRTTLSPSLGLCHCLSHPKYIINCSPATQMQNLTALGEKTIEMLPPKWPIRSSHFVNMALWILETSGKSISSGAQYVICTVKLDEENSKSVSLAL
jgi:hypothetical protein